MLPDPLNSSMLLLRTDYSDQAAWESALADATAIHDVGDFPREGASLYPVESPELANLTAQAMVALPRAAYLSAVAVADAQTMRDHTVMFVDFNELNEQVGRTFRAAPSAIESIVINLWIANVDFFELADSAGPDGIYRPPTRRPQA